MDFKKKKDREKKVRKKVLARRKKIREKAKEIRAMEKLEKDSEGKKIPFVNEY